MHYGSLALTGGGVSLAGFAFGEVWLISAAFALVLTGALVVRFAFRPGKAVDDV